MWASGFKHQSVWFFFCIYDEYSCHTREYNISYIVCLPVWVFLVFISRSYCYTFIFPDSPFSMLSSLIVSCFYIYVICIFSIFTSDNYVCVCVGGGIYLCVSNETLLIYTYIYNIIYKLQQINLIIWVSVRVVLQMATRCQCKRKPSKPATLSTTTF